MVISPVSPGPLLLWRTGTWKWKHKGNEWLLVFHAPSEHRSIQVKVVPSKPGLCSLFVLWGVLFSILTEEQEQIRTLLAPIKQILPILGRNNIVCSDTGRNLNIN